MSTAIASLVVAATDGCPTRKPGIRTESHHSRVSATSVHRSSSATREMKRPASSTFPLVPPREPLSECVSPLPHELPGPTARRGSSNRQRPTGLVCHAVVGAISSLRTLCVFVSVVRAVRDLSTPRGVAYAVIGAVRDFRAAGVFVSVVRAFNMSCDVLGSYARRAKYTMRTTSKTITRSPISPS